MRVALLKQIQEYLTELKAWGEPEAQWQITQLELRKKLISTQGLSVERLDNLQSIFLYYCTHIFKTGKHMTFQRLEYEKSHLTMDRFFLFLKDFSLTTAPIQGKVRQVLQRTDLVLLFKRVSVNCKDLNFEQFINCLEKTAILHYETKVSYVKKQEQLAQQRKKRKDIYLKKMKKRKEALEAAKKGRNTEGAEAEGQEGEDKATVHNEEPQAEQEPPAEEAVNNEPQGESPQAPQLEAIQQSEPIIENKQQSPEIQDKPIPPQPKPHLLPLTQQQKIQFFYQLINVDNTTAFKRRMCQLNLPLFQGQHRRAPSQMLKKTDNFAIPTANTPRPDLDEQKRLNQLRFIIEQRKQRQKALSPHMSKQDYQNRRKKRQQEEESPLRKDPEFRRRKIELGQLETDLRTLSKIPIDQIHFRRGNPLKLFESSVSDPYLEQYYNAKTSTHRSEKQNLTGIQANSQIVLDRLKKRAIQVQAKQKNNDSRMGGSQFVNASSEHRQRKNRLVEQLLERTKQLK